MCVHLLACALATSREAYLGQLVVVVVDVVVVGLGADSTRAPPAQVWPRVLCAGTGTLFLSKTQSRSFDPGKWGRPLFGIVC